MGRKKTYIPPNPQATYVGGKSPEALKRERSTLEQVVWNEDTIRYGTDDCLPMRIASIVDKSPATKSCLNTRAKFIKGASFSNKDLMKLKIDKDGTTLWQLHSKLSDILALFDGFSVNFKFDNQSRITSTYPLPFQGCRFVKPDESGDIHMIKFNPYFGTDQYKVDYTEEYPVFNIEMVNKNASDFNKADKKFKGQAYYYGKTSPMHIFYPVPDYWSAEFWINVDAKIQEFHANNLDKNFLLSVIWNVIGDPSAPSKNPMYNKKVKGSDGVTRIENPKTAGEEFNEMISNALAGSAQGGAGIAFWSGNHDTATKVSAFPTNSNHDLFTTLQDLTTKNITIGTQVPGILANISEGVNLGSDGNEMRAAIELMQSRVVEEQQILMDFYNLILLPNLSEPVEEKVEIVNFMPISVPVNIEDKFWEVLTPAEKRKWMAKNVPGIELDPITTAPQPGQAAPTTDDQGNVVQPPHDTTIPTDGDKINESLKAVGVGDINKIQKIIARYNLWTRDPSDPKGLTYEQAKQFLSAFGFTEEQLNAWLVKPEEI